MFSYQGLVIGALGLLGGIALGLILCAGFTWVEGRFGLIPGSIYRLDRIQIQIRFWDLLSISAATLGICYFATLAPAKRGAALSPVEGLRND